MEPVTGSAFGVFDAVSSGSHKWAIVEDIFERKVPAAQFLQASFWTNGR